MNKENQYSEGSNWRDSESQLCKAKAVQEVLGEDQYDRHRP